MSEYSDVEADYCNNSSDDYYSEDEFIDDGYDESYCSDDYHSGDSSNGERLNRLVAEESSKHNHFRNLDDEFSDTQSTISVIDSEFGSRSTPGLVFEHCDYCNNPIKCAPMYGRLIDITEEESEMMSAETELHFCDICCAKLFHDSVHRVSVDYKRYNKSIADNHVDRHSADIYKRIASTPFGALPIYMAAQENEMVEGLSETAILNNRNVFRNIYRKVVRNIIDY